MNFPTLYKKTSTGAIQFWKICSDPVTMSYEESDRGCTITTSYGQVNGKIQTTKDVIRQGKNAGRANATSIVDQAEKEAKAKWEKKKKSGYVESIEAAQAEELDTLIEGGIVPMLAHSFKDHGHKIKYHAYVQPKLDGIRCIAILKDGKCTLWSRTRKPITGVPHISQYIEQHFKGNIVFDGELYNHEYRNNFEKIVSFVRQDEPKEGHEVVQYHVYDVVTEDTFEERTRLVDYMLFDSMRNNGPLVDVETCQVASEDEIQAWFGTFLSKGYEGCMVRNADGKYANKRSYDLLKVKEFDEGEFYILGVEEGRGKLAGHAGAFLCRATNGKTFFVKMSGDTDRLRDYFVDHSLWEGKRLTVQYQGLTGAEGVPRFPVGKAIRDYE